MKKLGVLAGVGRALDGAVNKLSHLSVKGAFA
jgi:hypothetical protein